SFGNLSKCAPTAPINRWCRCTLTQVSEARQTPVNRLPKQDEVAGQFSFNPGRQRILFPPNHPYYEVANTDRANSERLWDLKRPNDES
ncbi:MAG: hypothetical protein AAFY41_18015, partial [Bacteroidota bacterium]